MAKIVNDEELAVGKVKYPWNEWFDGQTRELSRPEDFETTVSNMRNMIYVAAKKHGKKVTCRPQGNTIILIRARDMDNGAE